MKHSHQQPSHTRHDKELCTGPYQNVEWATGKNAEIVGGQCQSHRKHDDAEYDGLRGSTNPHKEVGHKKRQDGNGYDEKRGIRSEPSAQFGQ